jgi:UDP-N-acetylmuramate--alanine ligase
VRESDNVPGLGSKTKDKSMTTSKAAVRTSLGTPGRNRIKRIHFVGIGGIGMSGIAEVLLSEGYEISGSDRQISPITTRLASLGATIFEGHASEQVQVVDVLVVSAAVGEDNPEVLTARAKRIPIVGRAEMLAELMRFRYGIAIAGTHGKTTTTSLASSVLAEAGLDPTFVIGGQLNSAGSNAYLGQSPYLVTEADESDASFLHLLPMMAVVTNVDLDHMQTYDGDPDKLYDTFVSFLQQLPFYGLAILCLDDPGVQTILPRVSRPVLTYGFSAQADILASDLVYLDDRIQFTLQRQAKENLIITLNMPGKHNVLNALAAIAIATSLGVDDDSLVKSLSEFKGVARRFEVLGEIETPSAGKATLVSDYAHHPIELAATLEAAHEAYPNRRVVMAFQPHRYSRTRDLFDDFVKALSAADLLLVLPVYAAGEEPITHADSRALCRSIRQRGNLDPVFIEDEAELNSVLHNILEPNDVLLCCGAGSIGKMAASLMGRIKEGV